MNYLKILDRYGIQNEIFSGDVESFSVSLKLKYRVEFVRLLDNFDVVFLLKRRDISLDVFVEDSFRVSKLLDCRTVLTFELLSDTDIKRLVSNKIAFVGWNTIYLPFAGTIIENIKKPITVRKEYTINQQRVLIHILLSNNPVITPAKLVDKLGISIASIYRILKYFSEIGYIQSTHGEYIYLRDRWYIYNDSLGYFIKPILTDVYIPKEFISILGSANVSYFKSGIDALAEYSMLASSNSEYGIDKKELEEYLANEKSRNSVSEEISHVSGLLEFALKKGVKSFYSYGDDVTLALWKYKPEEFDGRNIDPISLSLLEYIKDDPRVKDALDELNRYIELKLKELGEFNEWK